jgi:L-aminopeptidase/D-esterase-like protein
MPRPFRRPLAVSLLLSLTMTTSGIAADPKPRARDLGVPFDGTPGRLNAITDVAGVEVGHATLIAGEGKLVVGKGPVRTGVTAILPRGRKSLEPVFASWFSLNGNGEMTGTTWIDESGLLDGPVLLTNTHSVGVVRDAVVEWQVRRNPSLSWTLPVVAETYDGFLNDINGMHVKKEHVFTALDGAKGGPVAEGSVGGGTGMRVHRFKGGIGTASRKLPAEQGDYHVGVLVQANYGQREQLRIAGVPVGKEITDLMPEDPADKKGGSIIIVVATDAPLLPHQLRALAKRAAMGLARTGSVAEHSSGDIFLAFSTAERGAVGTDKVHTVRMLPNDRLTPLFNATVEATEEAIVNAMIAAEDMTGINGRKVYALPHERLRQVLKKYGRLVEK